MNIFIYEYFCGGGSLGGGSVNDSMLAEGGKMLNSALADFAMVEGIEPYFDTDFSAGVKGCDAALIIAPETDRILQRFTDLVYKKGKRNLGCLPDAIRKTGDKLAFAKLMKESGIAHPATCLIDDRYSDEKGFGGLWISKPVDGAGSGGIVLWDNGRSTDYKFINGKQIAQEYVKGEPMSISIVSSKSESIVLAINRQFLSSDMKYLGGEVTNLEPDDQMLTMVNNIKSVIPGLEGYWGIDYVATNDGPVVIEVNPRLTTSFAALSGALNINPAQIIVAANKNEKLAREINRRKTSFDTKGKVFTV